MGMVTVHGERFEYQFASDVTLDGIRLEVYCEDGTLSFDVSIPDGGRITINTGGREADAELIEAILEIARRPR